MTEKRQTERPLTDEEIGPGYAAARERARTPTAAPGANEPAPAGSRFICGYCRKDLGLPASACDCAGWKAATAKLQSMAAETVAPGANGIETSSEPAVRQVVLSSAPGLSARVMGGNCASCGKPRHSHGAAAAGDPLGCRTAGSNLEAPAAAGDVFLKERRDDPLLGRWVTCDFRSDPHPYDQDYCRGVIQIVPAPEVEVEDARLEAALAERDRLTALINTPEILDFVKAVQIEAVHQRERWGAAQDEGKTAADWFWLLGYLAGKALHSDKAGDRDKLLHHIVTTAAACANWHAQVLGKCDMRPGIATPAGEAK